MGKVNFKSHSFATHNFHCGHFVDGDNLEKIIQFRRDDLNSYYDKTKQGISPLTKLLTIIFRFPIKQYLQSQSEPLKAYKTKDKKLMERFFEPE
ncbi:MAG: hypothetical protein LC109_06705 [Bacteroidia bacterium]|nr:hypothetical protein [Bacteroidia bacterium]